MPVQKGEAANPPDQNGSSPCFFPAAGNRQLQDGESSQKAVPLSQNNKWEAIIAFRRGSIDFNSRRRRHCCSAGPAFMSGHKTGARRTVQILSVYYNEKFINCPITHLFTGYSRYISNYFHMGHTHKTNNLVIYCHGEGVCASASSSVSPLTR